MYFFVADYQLLKLVLPGKLKGDLQPVLLDWLFWHYVNEKAKKHINL